MRAAKAEDLAGLTARFDQLEAELRKLSSAVAAIVSPPCTAHEAADGAALADLATVCGSSWFTAGALHARLRVDPALAAVLRPRGLDTPAALGVWLRRVRRRPSETLRLVRGRRTAGGHSWRIEPV